MKSKLRKAWSLPASDWRLLARAWAWLLIVDLGLRLLPFKTLQARLEQTHPTTPPPGMDEAARIRRVSLMVDRARRLHLYPMTCLRRSLALQRLLAADGISATLRFGVRPADPPARGVQAHAWLERDGRPISEPEALVDRYVALAGPPSGRSAGQDF